MYSVSVDAGFVYGKASVISDTIKWIYCTPPCTMNIRRYARRMELGVARNMQELTYNPYPANVENRVIS
jgi:hypothetical protein